MNFIIQGIIYLAGLIIPFLGHLFKSFIQPIILAVSFVLTRYALRITLATAFYLFAATKVQPVLSSLATAHLPSNVLSLMCITGLAQGFNLILSAFFVATALRVVRVVFLK